MSRPRNWLKTVSAFANGIDGNIFPPHGDEVDVDHGDDVGVETNIDLILNIIAKETGITQKNIAIRTGLSTRTVSREMKELRDKDIIQRAGPDRSGYWEIVK